MKPETLFHQLLGLGDAWKVEQVSLDQEKGALEIRVSETAKLWESERCPHDGSGGVSCHDHVPELRWRHLNAFAKECEIVCDLPRGKCPQCGRVWRVTPPWEGRAKHFTKEFEAFALTLMREMPVRKAAEILKEHDTRMWRLLRAYVDTARSQLDMSEVVSVGVDEMSRAKGHRYLTVFADMIERRVLFATPGKDSSTWDKFSEDLLEHNGHPHALTSVSMDMSEGYAKGVRDNCRNAQIVYDKFHIVKHSNDAVDKVRQEESKWGSKNARESLMGSRWLWLSNPENLAPDQKRQMKRIDLENLQTGRAYQMRLSLQDIYSESLADKALKRMEKWIAWVRRDANKAKWSLLSHMRKVADMIERHLPGVMAHWNEGVTNAFMEGLNSVFSAVIRKARGFKSVDNMIAMLYFVAGKLTPPALLTH